MFIVLKLNKYFFNINVNLLLFFIFILLIGFYTIYSFNIQKSITHQNILKNTEIVNAKLDTISILVNNSKDINIIDNYIDEKYSELDRNGILLITDDTNNITYINKKAYLRKIEQLDLNKTLGYKIINIDNGKHFIFTNKSNNHKLILFLPYNYITDDNTNPFYKTYFLWIGIALSCVIIFIFTTQIYFPIKEVENTIDNIINGNFDYEIKTSKNNINELGYILKKLSIMISKVRQLINSEYTAKILKKQAELNALQSQINPHFLYNTLEAIRGQAIWEGCENIANMSESLSNLFRYSISQNINLVTLREELSNMDNYLFIQQCRFNKKFNIIKKIDNDVLDYKLPKLSLQPIIENAIHHGLETKIGKGNIIIRAVRTEKRLIINIKDDGVGIKKEKLQKLNEKLSSGLDSVIEDDNSTSIGLINVNERIKLYFGGNYGIKVYSTYNFETDVELVLPLVIDTNKD